MFIAFFMRFAGQKQFARAPKTVQLTARIGESPNVDNKFFEAHSCCQGCLNFSGVPLPLLSLHSGETESEFGPPSISGIRRSTAKNADR